MPASAPPISTLKSSDQHWGWWPVFPLYPYGRRLTLVRELIPDRVWSFEQLHGVWYVAVPIRMTVVRLSGPAGGLLLYAPVPPTDEVLRELRWLEERHGPVVTIVLGTASGLEHKVPAPAMVRAFPRATLWVADGQWSFPLSLPSSWLGLPKGQTRVLGRDGFPHPDQFSWIPLGPLDLGLGPFLEWACLDHGSGSLLVTDSLVSIQFSVPPIYSLDPVPLLFHARERGSEPLVDSPEARLKGWKRILLFANYFRPDCISIPSPSLIAQDIFSPGTRNPHSHYGFYPFRWDINWEAKADQLIIQSQSDHDFMLAPVLERLVFVRTKSVYLEWLRTIAMHKDIHQLIPAHYHAPINLNSEAIQSYADHLECRDWAPSAGCWRTLASIDKILIKLGVVPNQTESGSALG